MREPDETDANLLLRRFVLEGNQDAFARLHAIISGRLMVVLKAKFYWLPEQDHQDTIQEVFIKIYKKRETFNISDDKGSNAAFDYIRTCAINMTIDKLIRDDSEKKGMIEVEWNDATETERDKEHRLPAELPSTENMKKALEQTHLSKYSHILNYFESSPDKDAIIENKSVNEDRKRANARMYKQVSRFRRQMKEKFGTSATFIAFVTGTLGWIKENFRTILTLSLLVVATIVASLYIGYNRIRIPGSDSGIIANNSPEKGINQVSNSKDSNTLISAKPTSDRGTSGTKINMDSILPHFAILPDKVEVLYTGLDISKIRQIEALLNEDSVKCQFIDIEDRTPNSNCYISYYSDANKQDMINCAKYVQNRLDKVFPNRNQMYVIAPIPRVVFSNGAEDGPTASPRVDLKIKIIRVIIPAEF